MSENFIGYCSLHDFKATLAQTLTTGAPNPADLTTPAFLAELGNQLDVNSGTNVGLYSVKDIYYYIRQGQAIIDAAIGTMYITPLVPVAQKTLTLSSAISEYAQSFTLLGGEFLLPGHRIVFTDCSDTEVHEIETIDNGVITTVNPIMYDYSPATSRVLYVEFPDPIPFICSKLACASFYDKWARAQQEPMKTEFGDTLRKEAKIELDNIREGRTILYGVNRIGARFANPNLYGDAWFKIFKSPSNSAER